MQQYDVVIVGAGAAGMMCAAEAGKRGRRVLVIDHAKAPGEKIRISGGGRCNFTNLHTAPEAFISGNSRFCLSALNRYTARDFVRLVERHGVAYHEKTLGQLFCDDSSRRIIDLLRAEMQAGGVELRLNVSAEVVERTADGFTLKSGGQTIACRSLVAATGGKSIPKMGATGWGYELARRFGLEVTATRAGLVPFTLHQPDLQRLAPLAGVSAPVIAARGKRRFEEAMLFTHRGLSGPAMLQISSYWREGEEVTVNLLPGEDVLAWLKAMKAQHPKSALHTVLGFKLPRRLAVLLAGETADPMAGLSDKALARTAEAITLWRIKPGGTEGYRTAEVTLGGVETRELDSRTLEARNVPGLYFIGEVVDVTGWLGGYNFQWAWSSGWAAGQVV